MSFFEARREARRLVYATSSTAAVTALEYLREQTFPRLIEPPRFMPRTRGFATEPEWVQRLLRLLTPQVITASIITALALLLATALPAWAALQGGGQSPAVATVSSSAGVTGTATSRVADLSATTFVGQLPAVDQARFFDARAGTKPEALRFVDGAREASLAAYIRDVSSQIALPYLSDAVATKGSIDAWTQALAEAEKRAAEREAALRSNVAGAYTGPVWQGGYIASGTRIAGARVTFYACIGNGFCGNMASGMPPFAGAAACSTNLPFGTKFVIASDPSQRVFVCLDRGALSPTWVDVWFYDAADGWAWQRSVGMRSDIIIVD